MIYANTCFTYELLAGGSYSQNCNKLCFPFPHELNNMTQNQSNNFDGPVLASIIESIYCLAI